jgi:hypothetical protein
MEQKVAKETFKELGTSIQQRCHVQRLVLDVMASVCSDLSPWVLPYWESTLFSRDILLREQTCLFKISSARIIMYT